MSSSSNYTLLIQGPIFSPGRTGITMFNKVLNKDSFVEYYCEDNLIKLVTDFGHLFKSIYIITWIDEQLDATKFEKFKNCTVIKLQNTTPNLKIDNKQLPTDFNNKFKQFYALSKGLEKIKNEDTDYVIKIRTDQYLDLKALIDEHQSAIIFDKTNLEKIFIPYINDLHYQPADFYFAATKTVLTNFINAMLWGNYIEFNSSVHVDMSLKYAYLYYRKELDIPMRTYFLNSFTKKLNQDKIKLRNYLSTNIYVMFSSDILEKTIWRGSLMTLNEEAKKSLIFANRNAYINRDEKLYRKSFFIDFLFINVPAYMVVRFPFIRNTFIESFLKKTHDFFIKK